MNPQDIARQEAVLDRADTPEEAFRVDANLVTRDAIECAIVRAESILMLVMGDHQHEIPRHHLDNVLWAVQGQLAQLKQMIQAFNGE